MTWRRACLASIILASLLCSSVLPAGLVLGAPQLHVNTDGISNITSSSAKVIGDLISFGPSGNANVLFQWGLTSNNATANETPPQQVVALGSFSADLSGLSANTTYYYRAKGVAQLETDYGPWKSFITLSTQGTTYTLTYTAGPNGTVSGITPQTVAAGSSGTAVTAVPNTGYHFVNWSDGSTANPRADSNVVANVNVTANFAINTYTLIYAAGANGSVTGTLSQAVNYGASGTAVTAVPDAGYHFTTWSDGNTTNPRTDSNVTVNINVTANFAADTVTYTLTYTAGANGSISGASPQTVAAGSSGTAVSAVPNTGYRFVNWSDGSTANPRTDSSVSANINVTASFAINTYTLTYAAGANGSVTGTLSQVVNYGATGTAVTAVPGTGYHFTAWSDGNTSNPRTDSNVTANVDVTANFAVDTVTYTLTYTAGANGSISGASPQTVAAGSSGTAVSAVPNTDYRFVNWSDGSTANPRTDSSVSANINVTASFAINTYTLTYAAGANGSVTGTLSQVVNYGATGTAVTAVPGTGYHFTAWSDGNTSNPRTDSNVTANVNVTANFGADAAKYTLTVSTSAGGTVTSPGVGAFGPYNAGSVVSLVAVASTGFHFVNWTGSSTIASSASASTTITMNGNYSIQANFAADALTYTLTVASGSGGTVTSPGVGQFGPYNAGLLVNLVAAASSGYHFVDWTGSTVTDPNSASTTITMNGNYSVQANFAANPQPPAGGGGDSLGGGGGGGGGVPAGPGVTSLAAYTNADGVFNIPATPKSDDGKVQVDIVQGVQGRTKDGGPLKSVSVVKASDAAPPSSGSTVVVPAYDFGPDGATFSPPITLEFSYDRTVLPPEVPEKNLKVVTWDPASGTWTEVESTVDAAAGRIAASVSHFSRYAVTVSARPAALSVGGLSISPGEAKPGDAVSVSVTVTNQGDIAGSLPLALKVDGKGQSTQDVSVQGSSEQRVSFTVTSDVPGQHQVDVNGVTGSFTLSRPAGPATFTTSLSVSSSVVDVGKPPVVSVLVKNTGESSGSRPVIVTINGKQASSSVVELAPGAAKTLDITATADIPGSYTVDVDGHSATYVVNALPVIPQRVINWWLVGLAVAAVTAAASFAGFRLRGRGAYVPPVARKVSK